MHERTLFPNSLGLEDCGLGEVWSYQKRGSFGWASLASFRAPHRTNESCASLPACYDAKWSNYAAWPPACAIVEDPLWGLHVDVEGDDQLASWFFRDVQETKVDESRAKNCFCPVDRSDGLQQDHPGSRWGLTVSG